jgi:hypothetical protein
MGCLSFDFETRVTELPGDEVVAQLLYLSRRLRRDGRISGVKCSSLPRGVDLCVRLQNLRSLVLSTMKNRHPAAEQAFLPAPEYR